MKKKVLAAVLAAGMVVSMAACGSGSTTTASTSSNDSAATTESTAASAEGEASSESGLRDTLTVAISTDWKSLEPHGPNQDGKPNFIYNIYESLFDMDNTGNIVPNLAYQYTVADDSMSVSADLYDCIYDSDGNHVTADDVVYSINWLVDSGNALGYDNFDHIEKTGDYQVTFYVNEEIHGNRSLEQFFLRSLIFTEKAFNDHNFATDPVGTGNYKVTNVITGSSLTMELRDDYWADADPEIVAARQGYHQGTVKTVTFQIISEAANAAIALEMGTVDCCDYVAEDMLPEFDEGGQYADQYSVVDALSSDFYIINPNRAEGRLCSDENLMKAIYYALDNTSIASAMGGSYKPLGSLGFSYFGDWDTAWESEENYINTYDPELAKEYLAKSSYNGETLVMIGLTSEVVKNAMTMIQAQLAQVGIDVSINAYDQDTCGATMASPDGWDFVVNMAGGTSFIGTFGAFKDTINDGLNKFWFSDPTLTELKTAAEAYEATSEDTKAFNDYILEHGYQYCIAAASSSIVVPEDMEAIYQREGYFTPAACTFK